MEPNADALRRFQSATGEAEGAARTYLRACNGDVDEAVRLFFASGQGGQAPARPAGRDPPQAAQGGGVVQAVSSLVGNILASPYRLIKLVAESSLRDPDDILLARDFTRAFEFHYGAGHPEFAELGWRQATEAAEQQSRFLFAYVHSPEHQDTDDFCRHVLSSNQVVTFLNSNFVCWGGNIQRAPGFSLAANTGATTYPFMCLLGLIGAQVTVVASIQGKISGSQLINVLQQSLNEQGAVLVSQRAERRQMELDRQLRMDQDLEYQRALEADRERERKNREAAAARAAEEEEARREAEQKRLAEEAALQRKQDQKSAIIQRRLEKQTKIKPEPTGSTNVIQIRVRLPDGAAHNRKFLESDQVQAVYDFVDTLENLHCWDYTLASSYPKIEFSSDTRNKSLVEVGVEHSATLLVQSHDD